MLRDMALEKIKALEDKIKNLEQENSRLKTELQWYKNKYDEELPMLRVFGTLKD